MRVRFALDKTGKYLKDAYSKGLVSNSFWVSKDEVDVTSLYIILINGNPAGFIQAYTGKFKNNRKYLFISMIELYNTYRGKGIYGKVVVNALFEMFGVSTIRGEAIADAIPFWLGIGADFGYGKKRLEEFIEDGDSCYFTLSKVKFNRTVFLALRRG